VLSVTGLSAGYGSRRILEGLTFTLRPHTITAVLGPNGAGKSTLLGCITQEVPYTGQIFYQRQDLALLSPRERAKAVAVLPQLLPSPPVTVEELAAFGRAPYLDFGRRMSSTDRDAVERALVDAGALHLRGKLVPTLSGGERQRAFLAMVLAQDTRLILLDEPTTYLDMSHQRRFLSTLSQLREGRKKTLLVVMHDLSQAVQYADHILVLEGGRLRFDGPTRECLAGHVLEEVFQVKAHTIREGDEELVFFSPRPDTEER
jgi:ABC-type cobalamin/Fe3+-siderophores transport system ATPase subunit